MRPTRSPIRLSIAAAVTLTAALLLSACGGGGTAGPVADLSGGSAASGNDVNPIDPATLRQGGEIVWPVTEISPQFNHHHVQGALGATREVTDGIFPLLLRGDEQGRYVPDPDFVESAEITGRDPQVVTYRLNPAAVWSDGRAMDWTDFDAMWRALNGSDPAFEVANSTGYTSIASIAAGTTANEVVVTFAQDFADWRGLFLPFYPRELMADPATFNTALTEQVPVSGGPFRVESIDRTAQRLITVPNPAWWGAAPRLDRIIYTAMEFNAMPEAYANGSLSFFPINGNVAALQRAQQVPDTAIRVANGPNYRHITFNGAPSSILADPALRRAIMKGVDRRVITDSQIAPIVPGAQPLGNHLYVQGVEGYQDNSGIVGYDPEAARRELDALGWVLPDGATVRVKDGRELVVRDVVPSGVAAADAESKIVQQQLAQVGVRIDIQTVPIGDLFSGFINPGDFDMVHFTWLSTPTPVSFSSPIYRLIPDAVGQNFGRIGSDEINTLLDRANAELDPAAQRDLANELDRALWEAGHSLLLYQRPDAWAVRADLANVGAAGFADLEYERIGWQVR